MPDTEITRAETRERARLLLVRSYEVDFDFTRGPRTFGSVSLIRFDCREPGSTTHADFDQPDLKAVFTVRVTAPAGWVMLSDQPQADVERTLHDSQTVRFQPIPALPTFTTTVVAGDYHLVTASHTTPGGQRIPLELACRTGLADRLDIDALLPLTARGLDYYTSRLGADYSYAKYGQVFVREFPHLASEDAPAYRDDRLPSAHPVASGASTVSDTLTRVGGTERRRGRRLDGSAVTAGDRATRPDPAEPIRGITATPPNGRSAPELY
jgi:hypothetical protein